MGWWTWATKSIERIADAGELLEPGHLGEHIVLHLCQQGCLGARYAFSNQRIRAGSRLLRLPFKAATAKQWV